MEKSKRNKWAVKHLLTFLVTFSPKATGNVFYYGSLAIYFDSSALYAFLYAVRQAAFNCSVKMSVLLLELKEIYLMTGPPHSKKITF